MSVATVATVGMDYPVRGIADGAGRVRRQNGRAQAGENSFEKLHRGLTADRAVYPLYCGASLGESAYTAQYLRAGREALEDGRDAISDALPQYFTL
ncbi:MAG: hypothetical protein AAB280_10890, partial [Pseudomonadota bacterium]